MHANNRSATIIGYTLSLTFITSMAPADDSDEYDCGDYQAKCKQAYAEGEDEGYLNGYEVGFNNACAAVKGTVVEVDKDLWCVTEADQSSNGSSLIASNKRDGDNPLAEFSDEEVQDWIEQTTRAQMEPMAEAINRLDKLERTVEAMAQQRQTDNAL